MADEIKVKKTLEEVKTLAATTTHFSEWHAAVIELLAQIEINTRK